MKILEASYQEAAQIALQHRLYVSGWALSGVLKIIRDNPDRDDVCCIVVTDYADKPVAVAVYEDRDIMAFTRKSCRRRGYATLAVQTLLDNMSVKKYYPGYGAKGCEEFWKEQGLR